LLLVKFARSFTTAAGKVSDPLTSARFLLSCSRNAGVAALDSSAGQLSQAAKDRVRDELATRTGDTDSEADVE
jgi:hypothetical protein